MKDGEGRGDGAGEIGEVRHVLEEERGDPDTAESGVEAAGEGCSGEDEEQGKEVEGEDAEGAAGVEVASPVRFAERVPEDAGDEEAGEREEERDAGPAGLEHMSAEADGGEVRPVAAGVVVEKHGEDGDAADAVEGWEVARPPGGEQAGRDS